jgi:FkbM family methyltransferase
MSSQSDLEKLHRTLNAQVPTGRIALREGLELVIDEGSRMPFEAFCFRFPEMRTELDFFLKAMVGRKALLDIGSLHGIFSMVFTQGRPSTTALAIEPSPIALQFLRRNLALNPDLDIRILDLAAGDIDGYMQMAYEWQHLMPRPSGPTRPDENVTTIRSRRIDDVVIDLRFRPDLVKIDVEGFETRVLRGMTNLLERLGPDLLIELHGKFLGDLGSSVQEVFDILVRCGYSLWDMAGEPINPVAEVAARLQQLVIFHVFASKTRRVARG